MLNLSPFFALLWQADRSLRECTSPTCNRRITFQFPFYLIDQTKDIFMKEAKLAGKGLPLWSEAKTGIVHSGGVFIEKKAAINEWDIWVQSHFDAREIWIESLSHRQSKSTRASASAWYVVSRIRQPGTRIQLRSTSCGGMAFIYIKKQCFSKTKNL